MKHLRDIALASAAIICGSNSAANAEKWSCEMEMSKGKTYKQEWIVSDDKMFASKGKGYLAVARNDNDILFAFLRIFEKDQKGRPINKPTNYYVMIVKTTGTAIEFGDILADVNYGPKPEQWTPPVVTIGHCSLEP